MLDNLRRKKSQISDALYASILPRLYAFSLGVSTLNLGKLRLSSQASKSFRYFNQKVQLSYELCAEKGVVFKMLECPKGTFEMGHIDGDDEPRPETIDTPFLLGQTEVTQELYEAVTETNPSEFKNNLQNPVEKVSWVDAILFCNKLSGLHGLDECYTENPKSLDYGWDCDFTKNGYRLPREKEWEYAAKAGTQNQWPGTDDENKIGEYGWFGKDWEEGSTPVATKLPNEWGFYDMSGNVWEWCWDKYDPTDKASFYRVIRGGGWDDDASRLSSVFRNRNSPRTGNASIGFRVCRTLV